MGELAIIPIVYSVGVIIMFGPLAFIHCVAMVASINGVFAAVRWSRMIAIVLSLAGAALLVFMLNDYGIGVATLAIMLISLFVRQRGLRLVRFPLTTSADDDAPMHVRTGRLSLTSLLTIALTLACLYSTFLFLHPEEINSEFWLVMVFEVAVIASIVLGVAWLCLRDPLRPVVILILVGCLWPWLSPLVLAFVGPLPPSTPGRIFPSGLFVLPLSIPMSAVAFLTMRSLGMRLRWSNRVSIEECVASQTIGQRTTNDDP